MGLEDPDIEEFDIEAVQVHSYIVLGVGSQTAHMQTPSERHCVHIVQRGEEGRMPESHMYKKGTNRPEQAFWVFDVCFNLGFIGFWVCESGCMC